MNQPTWAGARTPLQPSPVLGLDSVAVDSGVSWPAIVAGAAGAAALSLILLVLGTGLGLSSVSPWSNRGIDAATFGVSTILWISFTQLAASGMGGYLAGRLRSRWGGIHTDEVYFRDTAHGFLAWAVATLATAALLTSAIGSILNSGAQAGAAVAGGAAVSAVAAAPAVTGTKNDAAPSVGQGYFIDTLFRKDASVAQATTASGATSGSTLNPGADDGRQSGAEAGRIFANAASSGTLSPEDTKYVAQLVAQRTGLAQADAEKRVSETFSRMQVNAKEAETAARDAADEARKASAYSALWLFVSLLLGAFIASLTATIGGRRRDMF